MGLAIIQTSHVARGAYEPSIEPQGQGKDQFAKQIAEKYTQHAFSYLTIIASSHFFGLLEKHLSNSISKCINRVI